jgi:hypothetical protein
LEFTHFVEKSSHGKEKIITRRKRISRSKEEKEHGFMKNGDLPTKQSISFGRYFCRDCVVIKTRGISSSGRVGESIFSFCVDTILIGICTTPLGVYASSANLLIHKEHRRIYDQLSGVRFDFFFCCRGQ